MPVTIDATVGGASANSYIDATAADTILAQHNRGTAWSGLSSDVKNASLIMATRSLEQYSFRGSKASTTQALRWPRDGVVTRDGDEIANNVIPDDLKYATAELAYLFSQENRFAEAGTEGFSQITLGSLSLTIDKHDRKNMTPDYVRGFIAHYIMSSPFNATLGRA